MIKTTLHKHAALAALLVLAPGLGAQTPPAAAVSSVPAMVGQYCIECHDADAGKGGLNLEAVLQEGPKLSLVRV